jgi:deoxyadenosine/deoxycytidine kinase
MRKTIKRNEIDIIKSQRHYFLDINSEYYSVYRAFDRLEDLIKHLREINKKIHIEDLNKIITEIKLRNTAYKMEEMGVPLD